MVYHDKNIYSPLFRENNRGNLKLGCFKSQINHVFLGWSAGYSAVHGLRGGGAHGGAEGVLHRQTEHFHGTTCPLSLTKSIKSSDPDLYWKKRIRITYT